MLPLPSERPQRAGFLTRYRGARLAAVQQHARLSIGVAGVAGGALLLAGNLANILLGGAALTLIPLSANVALLFGGIMFLRERRKAARLDIER